MKKSILIFISCFTILSVFGQNIEMEEDVRLLDIKRPTHGQNLRHFDHWYLEYGLIAPIEEQEGAEVKIPYSFVFSVGNRYKLKLTNFLAIGASGAYQYASYRIKQNQFKQIPSTTIHRKEKFIFHKLYGDAYLRINFGKRGNIVGKFIDFGGYGSYIFASKHEFEDKVQNASPIGYAKTRQTNMGLKYINRLNYGLTTRIGINRYVIFAHYRLTDIFTSDFKTAISPAELSRYIIGIQIGLH